MPEVRASQIFLHEKQRLEIGSLTQWCTEHSCKALSTPSEHQRAHWVPVAWSQMAVPAMMLENPTYSFNFQSHHLVTTAGKDSSWLGFSTQPVRAGNFSWHLFEEAWKEKARTSFIGYWISTCCPWCWLYFTLCWLPALRGRVPVEMDFLGSWKIMADIK